MSEREKNGHQRLLRGGGLALVLIALFLAVFWFARKPVGAPPPMPKVDIDAREMALAVKRLHHRAASLKMTDWHHELIEVFKAFNLSEARNDDEKTVAQKLTAFVAKTEIAQTARKSRYIQTGDYLAVQFESRLNQVLAEIRQKGLEKAMADRSDAYSELLALSGNFFKNSMAIGLIKPNGELRCAPYIPQILFRKRWRVLSELPFRYQFLEIESLADAAYQLEYGQATAVETRLKAIRRIRKRVPDFDHATASALVYYQGKEKARALAVVKNALKKQPDNFAMNQFLLFLSNDTKL